MSKRSVIVELRHTRDLESAAAAAFEPESESRTGGGPKLAGFKADSGFSPTPLPGRRPHTRAESSFNASSFDLEMAPEESTYIIRGEVDEKKIDDLRSSNAVVGVFSDPVIESMPSCPSGPIGSVSHVEQQLCTDAMQSIDMDGAGVLVAIVDTGVNLAHLRDKGQRPTFNAALSWSYKPGLTPGSMPVGHGTMCAFDACIAAPQCTLLDITLLPDLPKPFPSLLSDAIRAYRHLMEVMTNRRPGQSLVVNNSWGMYHSSWDFPPDHPGNFSDNPNHPFNRIVGDLERAGADILFAAGNCGGDCPDPRCQGVADTIYGANSHPSVLCVAGVDVTRTRVGYSTRGPGRLTRHKPDLCGYTHFRGSGVYPADGGTSAATPVVAGVLAAIRTKRPYDPDNPATHPAAIRNLLTSTAHDLGREGYDLEHGFGVVNGCALVEKFRPAMVGPTPSPLPPPPPTGLCDRYPWLCQSDLCKIFPWLCRDSTAAAARTRSSASSPLPLSQPLQAATVGPVGGRGGDAEAVASAYLLGYHHAQLGGSLSESKPRSAASDCGCRPT